MWFCLYCFVFLCVCGQYNLSNTNLQLGKVEKGKWVEGRYSFKKNGRTVVGRTFWDWSIKTVPFCCLFLPCQDWFLPGYFTLCVSQNSLSMGLTKNGVSNSCTIVYALLWCLAEVWDHHICLFFPPVAFTVRDADKNSLEMKKAGSAPLITVVSLFYLLWKGSVKILAVQPHMCE